MDPKTTGIKYDKIAQHWDGEHDQSNYGVNQLERALKLAPDGGRALDVGCGAGGRFVRLLESRGYQVHGIDVSNEMISIAKSKHPDGRFEVADITKFDIEDSYELIFAWDSIFHLPLKEHGPVIHKLARALEVEGLLMFTFGDAEGEHTDTWLDDEFYYSSVGITQNLQTLINAGLKVIHLELDQLPHNHVTVMAKKAQTIAP